MTFTWSPDRIDSLLQHPSAEVRRWAVDKALELYPDTLCDRVMALIPSAPADQMSSILHRLAELDLPIADLEPLVEVTRSDAETEIKALAGAILLRSGYALLPEEIASVSTTLYTDIVGSNEQGFDLILETYRELSGESESFFNGIARLCNFADLSREVDDSEADDEAGDRIDYLCRLWGCDNHHLDKGSQPAAILSVLDQALAKAPPPDDTPWKRGLLAELERDRARLEALRQIGGEQVSMWSEEERRFHLAYVLCLWRNDACWSCLTEATGAAGLWRAIAMKPWQGVPDQALKDFVHSVGPEELLSLLSEALHQEYVYASYAFDVLNSVDTPGRFELFLAAYEGNEEYDDMLAEEAGDALRKAGAPAVEFFVERYPSMSEDLRTLVLFILDSFPASQVVDFCLEHFDDYMRGPAPEEFVGCLKQVASPHFLPPLLREWKDGEVGIGSAIKLISEINNVSDEQIDSIIRDTERRARHPEDAMAKPISSFPLRCTQCGHTYRYELDNIYVDKNDKPIIGDIIQCKGCGSIETYEIPARTHFMFTAEIIRLVTAQKAQPERPPDSFPTPFKFAQRIDMRALGQKVKSTGEAYRLLKGEIERRPQDAGLQRRMGNLLRGGGKPDLALPYYLDAIRMAPDDVESHHCVAAILIDQERYGEALPYLERLVPLCREGRIDEALRRQVFLALLEQVAIVGQETGHHVDIFSSAPREQLDWARKSVTIDIRSHDLSDPEDAEWLYQMFRHGRIPDYGQTPGRAAMPGVGIESAQSSGEKRQAAAARAEKIGRNNPCPCGSGKKYKKCCGR